MSTAVLPQFSGDLLAAVLAEENFFPAVPRSLEETGLSTALIESLICKYLAIVGTSSGRGIAEHVCLPFGVLEGVLPVAADAADPGLHGLGAAERPLLRADRRGPRSGPRR